MFWTRTVSGAVLVAMSIFFIITGGDVLLAYIGIISLIGMFELYRVFHIEKSYIGVVGYGACILYYLNFHFHFLLDMPILLMGMMILLMFGYVFAYPKYDAKQVMAALFGLIYVAFMLSYMYQIRTLSKGVYLTFLVFLCSWGCDTSAYCVGKLIGKHKMSPLLSPKKSIEGAVGGIVGAAFFTTIYCLVLREALAFDTTKLLLVSIISAVGALISMIGDLTASAIKRNYDIKDYGKLIPGHGGILDRFDSIIITAPIIYYLIYYLLS